MYLLNVETLQLTHFLEESTRPKYAILSHTWLPDDEEVTYDDLQKYHNALAQEPNERHIAEAIAKRPGFKKIEGCCSLARTHDFQWVWIDTCCINKSSSAELSEAINSMFKWYRDATICYAFLQDVEVPEIDTAFRQSRWFTRGWTLQELLAPRLLSFYDASWRSIGELATDSLCEIVSGITSIPIAFLKGTPLTEACVAKRMSWASKRETTRTEDVAYSLLGIFDVNMPLLYGEGQKAFIRLQEQIISQIRDDSILAWGELDHSPLDVYYIRRFEETPMGVLAGSPKDFEQCGDLENGMNGIIDAQRDGDMEVSTSGIKLIANLHDSFHPIIDGLEIFLKGSTSRAYAACELFCYVQRRRRDRIRIILVTDPLGRRPRNILGNIFGISFPQFARVGRIIRCDFPLDPLSSMMSRQYRGRSIVIAKDPISVVASRDSAEIRPRMILLEIPKGYDFDVGLIHPDYRVDVHKYRITRCSLRIFYEPERSYFCPLGQKPAFYFSTVIDAVPWISLAQISSSNPDGESNHPLGLGKRSRMSKQLTLNGITYLPHVMPLKANTERKEKGLDIQVTIEVKENSTRTLESTESATQLSVLSSAPNPNAPGLPRSEPSHEQESTPDTRNPPDESLPI
ncbi:heterokaryon incompatibility protein-domain-containing protein [Xylariaceae sp. FL1019]|nr:heterokaryon incompatibility protein-domain-containing protein [Xylariaceae sp. FL1019]